MCVRICSFLFVPLVHQEERVADLRAGLVQLDNHAPSEGVLFALAATAAQEVHGRNLPFTELNYWSHAFLLSDGCQ